MNRQVKKRFKMYKSGKNWVVAPITFLGLIAGIYTGVTNVAADQVSEDATVSYSTNSDAVQENITNEEKNQSSTTNIETTQSVNSIDENKSDTEETDQSVTQDSNAISITSEEQASNSQVTDSELTMVEDNQEKLQSNTSVTMSTQSQPQVAVAATNSVDRFAIGNSYYTQVDAVDVASYQNWMNQGHFNELKRLGVSTVIVKLTENTGYTNPYAGTQVTYARNAGLNIAVYHYARFNSTGAAQNEANHMVSALRRFGLGSNTLIFADMEDSSTYTPGIGSYLNTFWATLNNAGYNNHAVYTYQSYAYRDQVVSTVGRARTWIAQYPYTPNRGGYYEQQHHNAGYGAWQFSSTAYLPSAPGYNLDVSRDYNGLLKQISVSSENVGAFDSVSISGNTLKVSGWHAADAAKNQGHAYMIVFDATNNHEITRIAYNPNSRPDVAKVYPSVYNAGKSGFNLSINLGNYDINNKEIKLIARYSNQANGEGSMTDYWSKGYQLKQSLGVVDSAYIDGTKLKISGWHAATDAVSHPYNYVILYDATAGKEIGRQKVTAIRRDDVKRAYPNLYNAVNSGFSVSFDLSKLNFVAGHNLQVVMRYATNSDGEGDRIDIWSGKYNFNGNEAVIDTAKLEGTKLHVIGWHAADASRNQTNPYIILYDKTAGREIARIKVGDRNDVATSKLVMRSDVQRLKNYYNADKSGFDVEFDLTKLNFVAGHEYQIVSRYSDAADGEGHRTDVWSDVYKFTANAGHLDTVKANYQKNSLTVTGWHAADASINQKNAFIILYDATTGREITRQAYVPTQRPDVVRVYPNIYNAVNSGFNVTFKNVNLKTLAGHNLQVVVRYSNQRNGEGLRTDYWSRMFKI
ncbi:GH25 family lysozyme [Ligilactobacillus equi]|uniref:GH25 family lysozyme n=1 Tax=Ligilactobacillus equi TaxID=137357 RepID=UPI000468D04A|nr:GH25 family lysozyme [Ligilactobacillus equi]